MMPMMRKTPKRTHAQELVTLRNGKPVDQVLRELYLEQRLSQQQIAVALGVSRMTVAMWLREYGIDRSAIPA